MVHLKAIHKFIFMYKDFTEGREKYEVERSKMERVIKDLKGYKWNM